MSLVSGRELIDRLSPHRRLLLAAFDAVVWRAAVTAATLARLDFDTDGMPWGRAIAAVAVMAATFILIGWTMRLHQGWAALGTLDEMMRLGLASVSAGGLLFLINMLTVPSFVPRSIPLAATFGALVVMAWARATVRRIREIGPGASQRKERSSVLVIGAGNGGRQRIRSMRGDSGSRWKPVGLLDDNPQKRSLRIDGVPVLGRSADLAKVADETGAARLRIARPRTTSSRTPASAPSASSSRLPVATSLGRNPPMTLLSPYLGYGR